MAEALVTVGGRKFPFQHKRRLHVWICEDPHHYSLIILPRKKGLRETGFPSRKVHPRRGRVVSVCVRERADKAEAMLRHSQRARKRNQVAGLPGIAGILLIVVGLVGKLCTANAATTVHYQQHAAPPAKSTATPAQQYFDAVAPEDRENFIKYHLDRALEERLPRHTSSIPKDFEFVAFQDAAEPEHFSLNLLDHFMIAYGLSELDVYAFVALNVICFPSGWCFDPDDVGNICCPF
uniref:Uncharacterized protein n=1 Tax=Anopheles merus TaxID=30066 RepID=A0A182V2Q7_ANOME